MRCGTRGKARRTVHSHAGESKAELLVQPVSQGVADLLAGGARIRTHQGEVQARSCQCGAGGGTIPSTWLASWGGAGKRAGCCRRQRALRLAEASARPHAPPAVDKRGAQVGHGATTQQHSETGGRERGQRGRRSLLALQERRGPPSRRSPDAPQRSPTGPLPHPPGAATSPAVPPLACPDPIRREVAATCASASRQRCQEPPGRAHATEILVARRCCSEAQATRSSCGATLCSGGCCACLVILARLGSLPKGRDPARSRLPPAGAEARLCTRVTPRERSRAHGWSASHGW